MFGLYEDWATACVGGAVGGGPGILLWRLFWDENHCDVGGAEAGFCGGRGGSMGAPCGVLGALKPLSPFAGPLSGDTAGP